MDPGLSPPGRRPGIGPLTTPVRSCLSRPVYSIEDDELLVEAVRLMKEKEIRHLAVTEDQTIVGVPSVSDLLRYYSGVW